MEQTQPKQRIRTRQEMFADDMALARAEFNGGNFFYAISRAGNALFSARNDAQRKREAERFQGECYRQKAYSAIEYQIRMNRGEVSGRCSTNGDIGWFCEMAVRLAGPNLSDDERNKLLELAIDHYLAAEKDDKATYPPIPQTPKGYFLKKAETVLAELV